MRDRWKKDLAKEPEGRIILRNLEADKSFANLPAAKANVFWNIIDDLLKKRGIPHRPESLLSEAVEVDSSLLCSGKLKPPSNSLCVRIISVSDLLDHNAPALANHPRDDNAECAITREIECDPNFSQYLGNEIRTKRRLAWVTEKEELFNRLNKVSQSERAAVARDLVGMIGYEHQAWLVALIYPPNYFDNKKLTKPTAIDGAGCPVFVVDKSSSDWGKTFSLLTLKCELREAVHPPYLCNPDFKLEALGRVNRTCPMLIWEHIATIISNL